MFSVDELPAISAAELLARSISAIVGAAVRSVILHGSLSAGGYRWPGGPAGVGIDPEWTWVPQDFLR